MKYIKRKEQNAFPCLLATDSSLFTQRIARYKFISQQFNTLSNSFNLKKQVNDIADNLENNIEKFIEKNMPSKVFNKTFDSSFNSSKLNKSLNQNTSIILNTSSKDNQVSYSKNENKFCSTLKVSCDFKTSDEIKMKKLNAIAQIAELPAITLTKSSKVPAGQFKSPFISKNSKIEEQSFVLASSRPVKRTSDVHEKKANSEEDEDDEFISNQDIEALCSNQSLAKRKKI